MKFKYKLAILATVVVLTGGCVRESDNNPSDTSSSHSEKAPISHTTSKTAGTAKSGNFLAAEHPTKGSARIVNENGKRFVEFDENFKTDSGPDLFVVLHRNATVPNGIQERDYVQLAPLQKTNGIQRYAIPANIKLEDFKSVAIWCRQFNSTFGYAPLI
ncbi:MAG: DM13 domain-containing protein [Calothrix sp. C42_A2020_038]|nr:DM13 domain-containing protein [Calothrix sp. C42_A2020_038]